VVISKTLPRILKRSKKLFQSARAAWTDIGKKTGLEPNEVKSAGHTKKFWRWVKKKNTSKRIKKTMAKSKRKRRRKKLRGAALAQARKNLKKARAARRRPKRTRTKRRKTKRTKKRTSTTRKKSIRKKSSKKRNMVFGKNILNNPTIRKAAIGVGTGTIAATALALIAPGLAANPIVRPAVAFLAGGPIGAIAALLLSGGGIGNLFGGGSSGGSAGAGAA